MGQHIFPPSLYVQYVTEQQVASLYQAEEEVGRGSYSVVSRVTRLEDGQTFASKCLRKSSPDFDAHDVVHEYKLHRRLCHPNVVRLEEALETEDHVYLIMELAGGGSILQWFSRMHSYTESDVQLKVRQLLQTLAALHDFGVCHRDIKPDNVLLSDSSEAATVKICDFGLSCIYKSGKLMRVVCGTHNYLAPEMVLQSRGELEGYDHLIDVWGVGLVLFILMFGYNPFRKQLTADTHNAILSCEYSFPEHASISVPLRELILQMLVPRTRRLTVQQCLAHPFLSTHGGAELASSTSQQEALAWPCIEESTGRSCQDSSTGPIVCCSKPDSGCVDDPTASNSPNTSEPKFADAVSKQSRPVIRESKLHKMLKGLAVRNKDEDKHTVERTVLQNGSKHTNNKYLRRTSKSTIGHEQISTGITT